MAIFTRFRREQETEAPALDPVPVHLPGINQRVTLTTAASDEPIPSRVDDELDDSMVLASPNIPLNDGERIILTWEGEEGWYALESTIQEVGDDISRPTITISKHGRLSRYRNRRTDSRADVALPIDLRVVGARAIKTGRGLQTTTTSIGTQAVGFTTSAPFAPGDVVEAKLQLGEHEVISARLKVIRIDRVSGSWKQVCTASYEEILNSDIARIVAFLDSGARSGA